MKKICFFCGSVGRVGGTERVATVIASELAKRGYNVSFLSVVHGEESFFPLSSEVGLFSLHMEGHSANFSDMKNWIRLRNFLRLHEIDLLIDVDAILSWYSIPATWGTTTKVISWEHFHLGINVGDRYQRWRRSLGRRLAARFASAVVTLTERDRQQYLQQLTCNTRLLVIPNPQTIAHEKRSVLENKVVLAAGRLVPQKGFDLLLQAWRLVAADLSTRWRLRIVGSGLDETMLKALCARLGLVDSVEFIAHTTDMSSQYLDASIFALSSRFEGFPLVLLEAKSFGLPVVSFDCDCGPSDIVRVGEDGILVSPGNFEAFAHALRQLIEDESERSSMGQRGYEDSRFDLRTIVDQWQELIG